MSKKFRLSQLELTSDAANRSGLRTTNMTSATPDHIVWTTFKNVQVNENWELVVWKSLQELVSRVHIDSWALIQGNIYPDYQEQAMTISADRFLSVELPTWTTTVTVTDIKTVLHDDITWRGNFVFTLRKNGTALHTITLPDLTSTVTSTWLSYTFADGDKFSVEITTADASNTVGAEILLSYNLI